jgi:uncharacterized protein with PIN domain
LRDLERFIARASIQLVALDVEPRQGARKAFIRFGSGRHPAELSYAIVSALRWLPFC